MQKHLQGEDIKINMVITQKMTFLLTERCDRYSLAVTPNITS